jgi:phosphatidylinositol alpha-1,6-mannosyltransferase
MRILMLDNEFPPLGGGMGTANQALLRIFAHHPDMEIDLVTSALGIRREAERFAPNIQIFSVPVWNRNLHHSTNRELLCYAAQALPLARRLHQARPYDLCLAWSAVPAGGVALALRRQIGLPYLVWVSGPDIPGFEQRYRMLYPLLTPAIKAIWQDAAAVIAKCAEEIDMIHAVDPSVGVDMVPNGVDLEAFQPGKPIPDAGPLRLICSARLIERKGQHHLIDAVRQLKERGVAVQLELVGTGDAHTALVEQARRLDVSDRVTFAGYVTREVIPERYAQAHVFVLPSYNEGLSLSALEALAAGLPLVLTRTGGTADLLDEGINGFAFDWADVSTLTSHLARLANDRPMARRMGAASRERASRFSWGSIATQFLELFNREMSRVAVV